jgi:hypothetical protein
MGNILLANLGRLFLLIGLIALFMLGMPIVAWFVASAVALGGVVVGALKLYRKLHPQKSNLTLGVTRQPYLRFNESRLAPNIGLEAIQDVTRSGGNEDDI